jgi:hypothetical protein
MEDKKDLQENNFTLNEEGYVYVIWSPMYQFYGECYKIGSCIDINKRLNHYITSYPDPVEVKYISKLNINYKKIEKMVHYKLGEFRLNQRREFFKVDLSHIISVIEYIENNGYEEYSELLNKGKPIKYAKNKIQRIQCKKEWVNTLKEIIDNTKILSEIRVIIYNSKLNSYAKYMMTHCLDIINMLGFTSIYGKNKVIFNWETLAKYFYNNKRSIEDVFFNVEKKSSSKYLFKEKIDEETKGEHKRSITEFINRSMLKPLFRLKIIGSGKDNEYYRLEPLRTNK